MSFYHLAVFHNQSLSYVFEKRPDGVYYKEANLLIYLDCNFEGFKIRSCRQALDFEIKSDEKTLKLSTEPAFNNRLGFFKLENSYQLNEQGLWTELTEFELPYEHPIVQRMVIKAF